MCEIAAGFWKAPARRVDIDQPLAQRGQLFPLDQRAEGAGAVRHAVNEAVHEGPAGDALVMGSLSTDVMSHELEKA
ncbi:hypothetical protein FSC37_20210 [Piscinibacter aquaticus]|uniref:Uncharacterized protein n=1 Tax=Piscinibacter aquaticus TaxID=392597 RepID=A0A5C6U5P4_9BURK|nr:hypothetical protein FSC37_20210 [Piscinibacter aquaticus]